MNQIHAQWFNGMSTKPIQVICHINMNTHDESSELILYSVEDSQPLITYTKKQLSSAYFEYQQNFDDYVIFLSNKPPLARLQGSSELIDFLKKHFPKLHTASIEGRWTNRKILMLLMIVILSVAGVYRFVIPFLAEMGATFITVEHEKTLGKHIAQRFSDDELIKTSAQNRQYHQEMNQLLTEFSQKAHFNDESPYSLQLHLYPIGTKNKDEDIKNAFALPGGHIFIFPKLLQEIQSPEELIALIGHEATHVKERHSLKALSKSLALTVITGILFGDVTGISSPLIDAGVQFSTAQYSQTLEVESDEKSSEHLIQYGYNSQGLVDLLTHLKNDKNSSKSASEKNTNIAKNKKVKTGWRQYLAIIAEWISSILKLIPDAFWDWFGSHPNINKRIVQAKQLKLQQKILTIQPQNQELNLLFIQIKTKLRH